MSVQQNVVALHVPGEAAFLTVREQLAARDDVRVLAEPSRQGPGWVLLLESHTCMPEQLIAIVQEILGPHDAQLYSMNDEERLHMLAGNDPWADAARG